YVHLYRIDAALSSVEKDGEIRVAMFQTATSRKLLGSLTDYDHAAQSMNEVVSQALQAVYKTGATLDLMILPESAIPYHGVSPADKRVYSVTMHALLSYLNGISRSPILFNQLQQGKQNGERIYNTASLLGDGAAQTGIQNYRKRILIPFGEYLPGEQTFPWLRRFFPNAGRYSPEGMQQPVTMQMTAYPDRSRLILLPPEQAGVQNPESLWTHPGDAYRAGRQIYRRSAGIANNFEDLDPGPSVSYRFGILICYEDLIPELGISSFDERQTPDFLVNISNDSWLSHSRAMWQHYGAARFRSVETGRFLLRSTLTGISGVMDPAGRDFADHSTIDARGTILEEIPVQARVTTLFSILGDWAFLLLILICLTGIALDAWMERNHRSG
ncbi:MAG: apolipoprotein N-acyltransferase, partial [Leptospiraceae bacterium]|nr:apolipoprotein N-acyltransferase [Leptospiraceae bacterium]